MLPKASQEEVRSWGGHAKGTLFPGKKGSHPDVSLWDRVHGQASQRRCRDTGKRPRGLAAGPAFKSQLHLSSHLTSLSLSFLTERHQGLGGLTDRVRGGAVDRKMTRPEVSSYCGGTTRRR